jgi:hypothetical protein
MKKILILSLALLLIGVCTNAQTFFGPLDKAVTTKQLVQIRKSDTVITAYTAKPVVIFRPAVSATAFLIELGGDNPVTKPFSGVGFGVSVGSYTTDSEGNPWCRYALNGSLWTSMQLDDPTKTHMGLSVTGEFLNRWVGLGPVVYLDAGKVKWGIAVNVSYRF